MRASRTMSRGNRLLATIFASFAVCIGFIVYRQLRQTDLNYSLSDAVGRRDLRAICRLRREGADPRAPWSGYSFRFAVERMFSREPQDVGDRSILHYAGSNTLVGHYLTAPINSLPSDSELAKRAAQDVLKHKLFTAIEMGDNARMRSLLNGGVPVSAADMDGRTPLIYAVNSRNRAAVVYLLGIGADPNVQTVDGLSVLANAQIYGDSRFVPLLLSAGARANVQDKYGDTPLTEAAKGCNLINAELLLQHGADPNLGAATSPGSLDWAIDRNDQKMIRLLKVHGAKERHKPVHRLG